MKKYLLTVTIALSLFSCQTDEQYEDYNRDPKNPTDVASNFLFTNAIASMGDQMASANVNTNIFRFISQYWTATTYFDEPNYNIRRRTIPQNQWSEIYRDVILDIQNAKEIASANEELSNSELQARLGQLEVMEVYAWEIMVDTFGDVPYTEALNAKEFTLPKYDDARTIYENLIARLLVVSDQLNAGQGFTSADILYEGDMAKWNKFANSLLLRLGIMISDSNPELSQQAVEAAAKGGVFVSNDDSALLQYQSSTPNTNPLWVDLVQSGRADYVVANTIVDYMNDLNDPRRPFYFDSNLDAYKGGIYGKESNAYSSFTHVGEPFLDPTHPGILLDYAEVEFNLAAAAKLGYNVTGDAELHYTAGVTASILYWGGSDEDIASYLSQDEVSYDGSNDQLATQFWIAMYDNAFQGWNVWRKFNGPKLNVAQQSQSPIPLRYTYPTNEQTLNEANNKAAAKAIGGDEQQTGLFWDVK